MFLPLSCSDVPEQSWPPTFLPRPSTGLSSRLFQLRKLVSKEEETFAVMGAHFSPRGAFSELVWAQWCKLTLGFFGSCDGPEAKVKMLLCHTVPPLFPCRSSGILSFLIPYIQWEVKDNFLNGFWSSGLRGVFYSHPVLLWGHEGLQES